MAASSERKWEGETFEGVVEKCKKSGKSPEEDLNSWEKEEINIGIVVPGRRIVHIAGIILFFMSSMNANAIFFNLAKNALIGTVIYGDRDRLPFGEGDGCGMYYVPFEKRKEYIRRCEDKDKGEPSASDKETTKATEFSIPKITFWNISRQGSSDVETAVLDKCSAFLILTANSFTQDDQKFEEKVKPLGKSVFRIRIKIDQESKKEALEKNIKEKCFEYVKEWLDGDKDLFLINIKSVEDEKNWDMARLKENLLEALQKMPQKECLTLLLGVSKEMLQRKADLLQGRIVKAAAAAALSPDRKLILIKEVGLYTSQFGSGENVHQFCKKRLGQTVEEGSKNSHFISHCIILDECLKEVKRTAMKSME